MKKTICVLISCVILTMMLSVSMSASDAADNSLKFSGDGTFKILHLTDSQDDRYPAYDMVNFIEKAIEESQPDLIVFTGDLVEDSRIGDIGIDDQSFREGVVVKDSKGNIDHDKTLENLKIAADNVLKIFEKSEIPYVLAQGNNDHKCGITDEEWMEIYSEYPHCLLTDMSPGEGEGLDCYLPIKGQDGSIKFNLWIIDTGRGGVSQEQIDWYKGASAELTERNNGTPIPSIVFQHIHTADVGNLFEKCSIWDDGAKFYKGGFIRLNPEIARGTNMFPYEPGKTSEEFKAWKECGDVLGAYFGHQHTEGFTGTYDGIELGFTYGCEFAKIGPYGYRLFTINEDDVENYTSEMYVYKGNVKLGNDRFVLEKEKVNGEYEDDFSRIIGTIGAVFRSLFSIITGLVA